MSIGAERRATGLILLTGEIAQFGATTDSAEGQIFHGVDIERDRTSRTAANQSLAVQSRQSMDNAIQYDQTNRLPRARYLPCGIGMVPRLIYARPQNTWFDRGRKKSKLMEFSAAVIESILERPSPQDCEHLARELAIDLESSLDTFGFTDGLRVFAFS